MKKKFWKIISKFDFDEKIYFLIIRFFLLSWSRIFRPFAILTWSCKPIFTLNEKFDNFFFYRNIHIKIEIRPLETNEWCIRDQLDVTNRMVYINLNFENLKTQNIFGFGFGLGLRPKNSKFFGFNCLHIWHLRKDAICKKKIFCNIWIFDFRQGGP